MTNWPGSQTGPIEGASKAVRKYPPPRDSFSRTRPTTSEGIGIARNDSTAPVGPRVAIGYNAAVLETSPGDSKGRDMTTTLNRPRRLLPREFFCQGEPPLTRDGA